MGKEQWTAKVQGSLHQGRKRKGEEWCNCVCREGGREEGRQEVEAIVHDREGKGSGKVGGNECAKVIGESEKAGREGQCRWRRREREDREYKNCVRWLIGGVKVGTNGHKRKEKGGYTKLMWTGERRSEQVR